MGAKLWEVVLALTLVGAVSDSLLAQITIQPQFEPRYPDQWDRGPIPTARVTSQFEIRSVTATYSTQTFNLSLSGPGTDLWTVTTPIDITSVPAGTNFIRFVATDTFGLAAVTNAPFIIDRAARLTEIEPPDGALARPLIRIRAAGTDDLGTPTLQAIAVGESFFFNTAANHAEAVIDLSRHEESQVRVFYYAFDATRGGFHQDARWVLSLSNPRYQIAGSAPGTILDVNSVAMLALRDYTNLYVLDRSGHNGFLVITNSISATSGEAYAALTPEGFVAYPYDRELNLIRTVDYNRGDIIILGTNLGPFSVRGRFGLFTTNGGLMLRDFTARTNVAIPLPGNLVGSLGENGVVAVQLQPSLHGNAVYLFRSNQVTLLTPNTNNLHLAVLPDGTNTVWFERPANEVGGFAIRQHTPSGIVDLNTNYVTSLSFPSTNLIALNSGWTAFPRIGPQGQEQIWLRSPQGVITQGTFFSLDAFIRALGPDGSIVSSVGPRSDGARRTNYFNRPGAAPIRLSADFGARYFFVGNQLHAAFGTTLFTVQVDGEPIGLSSPQYNATFNTLSYYVTSTQPTGFVLQRSTNFVNWTSISTNSVTNTLPTKFQIATPPGIFRVQKQ